MRSPPRILVVDDEPFNRDMLATRLKANNYDVICAVDGTSGLEMARDSLPDLILLDVNMPGIDGIEVCRRLKSDPEFPFTPIIMVTALADAKDVVAGLEVGAEEYLTKPVNQTSLVARVKSMLRIKDLHDTVQEQARQLAEWNKTLENKVQTQLGELQRLGRLKRFLSPQLAEAVLSSGDDSLLDGHRREITVVFCDLRGYTAFSEAATPDEVMAVLHGYHSVMGELIYEFEGTLERFAGDGLMVFFNDPRSVPDHPQRAVNMAVVMQQRMLDLKRKWLAEGFDLDYGIGIDLGWATLGMIGYEGRVDYSAIGPVTNMASRLCDQAKGGEILISERVYDRVQDAVDTEAAGEMSLKGFMDPISVYNVLSGSQKSP